MFTPTPLEFIPTHRVIVENDDHEYSLGTLVKPLVTWGSRFEWAWYVDEEGLTQIMNSSELEAV